MGRVALYRPSLLWLVTASSAVVLSGCGVKNGRQWVADLSREPVVRSETAGSMNTIGPQKSEAHERGRPLAPPGKLDRVVTLGSTEFYSEEAPAKAPTQAPAPVVVIVESSSSPPVSYWGWGGIASPPGLPSRPVPPHRPQPGDALPPRLGGDWDPPADHGPPFPYRTAPADPWSEGPWERR